MSSSTLAGSSVESSRWLIWSSRRCESVWRASAADSSPSCSYRRALVTAMAAWLASTSSSSASAASNASRACEWTVSEPMAPCSPMSGALMTERMPCWRM